MINNNSLKLTMFQPLPYTRLDINTNSSIEEIYKNLLNKIDSEPIGCEAIIRFSYEFSDNIIILPIKVGYAAPPTEEVRIAVLKGETIPLPKHDMELAPGKYELIQIPITPKPKDLFSSFIPFICSSTKQKKGTFHFRLLKESAFAVLSQIILTSEE